MLVHYNINAKEHTSVAFDREKGNVVCEISIICPRFNVLNIIKSLPRSDTPWTKILPEDN